MEKSKEIILGFILLAFTIIVVILYISSINEESVEDEFLNSPCWYYTNQSANEIKLSEINSTEIDIFSNEKGLFVMDKNTKEEIPMCILK